MRIHVAVAAAASLLMLAGPGTPSSRASRQGIPLGDLVRVKPSSHPAPRAEVPTDRNPTISQISPGPCGTSPPGLPSTAPSSPTVRGAPITGSSSGGTVGGVGTSGTGVPSTTGAPSTTGTPSTPGGIPTTGGTPTTGVPSTSTTGVPSTTGV